MPSYTLGRDYTVSGLTGATDLTVSYSGERIDVTTRAYNKPFKNTIAGFPDTTFECTVYATSSTSFTIGQEYTVDLNGNSLSLICMAANREEPVDGLITYKLTFKPGLASDASNQTSIGPGTYRSAGS